MGRSSSDRSASIEQASAAIAESLADRNLENADTPAGAERLVMRIADCLQLLDRALEFDNAVATRVDRAVLTLAYPVLLPELTNPKKAAALLIAIWARNAAESGQESGWLRQFANRVSAADILTSHIALDLSPETHAAYLRALAAVLTRDDEQAAARDELRALKGDLSLSWDEVGQMIGVSGETVRRWEQGRSNIGPAERGKVSDTSRHLRCLLRLFRADRLAAVIRRRVELFGNESALSWMLRGRIADVVALYDRELTWQR